MKQKIEGGETLKDLFPIKVRHKTEGWTGEIELLDAYSNSYSSHRQYFDLKVVLNQDTHKPTGEYVEDPDCELEDLEII